MRQRLKAHTLQCSTSMLHFALRSLLYRVKRGIRKESFELLLDSTYKIRFSDCICPKSDAQSLTSLTFSLTMNIMNGNFLLSTRHQIQFQNSRSRCLSGCQNYVLLIRRVSPTAPQSKLRAKRKRV